MSTDQPTNTGERTLPPDDHSHSEWSWDALEGSMAGSCARAVEIGLPSIAFTEHIDLVRWLIAPERRPAMAAGQVSPAAQRVVQNIGADGRFDPPPLDVDGYLASVERCRAMFPGLRIVTGIELGEPHWFVEESRRLLATGAFERVLGSLHSVELDGELSEASSLYPAWTVQRSPADLVRTYLTDLLLLVESSSPFAVLAHVDYAVRRWPTDAGPTSPTDFEEEYRAVLRALARSGRALEVNTRIPLDPLIVRWWHAAGGQAVTCGSDAHLPSAVGHGFAEAAAMVESQGFRPGRAPHDFWRRAPVR
jgi:histidinol-phosphatase (PHP family)